MDKQKREKALKMISDADISNADMVLFIAKTPNSAQVTVVGEPEELVKAILEEFYFGNSELLRDVTEVHNVLNTILMASNDIIEEVEKKYLKLSKWN